MAGTVPSGDQGFELRVRALSSAVTLAVEHLADLDPEDDPVTLAAMLDDLIGQATALVAQPADEARRQPLGDALGHLREAHDLLDDGEPSDAVAVEVMSAAGVLRRLGA